MCSSVCRRRTFFVIMILVAVILVILGILTGVNYAKYNKLYNHTNANVTGYENQEISCEVCDGSDCFDYPMSMGGSGCIPSCYDLPYTGYLVLQYYAWQNNSLVEYQRVRKDSCGNTAAEAISIAQHDYPFGASFFTYYQIANPKKLASWLLLAQD